MGKSGATIGILLILIIICVVFLVFIVSGGVGGYKVTIQGQASYNMITGWDVTCDNKHVEEDGFFSLWYMPWETKDIQIIVELTNFENNKVYRGDGWVDKLNLIAGSTGFDVDVRHVPSGRYGGYLYLCEVEKGFFDWVPFITDEKTRVFQAKRYFGAFDVG